MIITDIDSRTIINIPNDDITEISIVDIDPEEKAYLMRDHLTIVDKMVYKLIGLKRYEGIQTYHNMCIRIRTIDDGPTGYTWIIFISVKDESVAARLHHGIISLLRRHDSDEYALYLEDYKPVYVRC